LTFRGTHGSNLALWGQSRSVELALEVEFLFAEVGAAQGALADSCSI